MGPNGKRCAALALLLGGCAQIFGIDTTSKAPDAADTGHASLTFDRLSIGASTIQNPLLTDSLQPAIFFSGGMPVPSSSTSTTWSTTVKADFVEVFLPDFPTSVPRTFALSAEDIHGLFGVLEHPNPTPAPPNASFALSIGLPTPVAAGESYQVVTVGSWSQHTLAPGVGATVLTDSYAFTGNSNITGRPLETITPDDAVLIVRYTGDELTALRDISIQMVDGVNMLTGGMAPIAIDQTLAVTVAPQDQITRLATPQPANTLSTLNWSLIAAPGYAFANNSGVQLRAGSVAATDTAISLPYGNPFATTRSWHPVFTFAPTGTRSFTPMGSLPVTLFDQLFEVDDASTGALTPTLQAGLPQAITLDTTPLVTDGLTVALDPTMPVTASFTTDVATNTLYQLQVFELVPDSTNTVLQFSTRLTISAEQPSFTIPPGIFEVGKTYTIRGICVAGSFPGLAQGDLTQRSLPLAIGLADAGVFTVMAPP